MTDKKCPVCKKTIWEVSRHQNQDGVITHVVCQHEYWNLMGDKWKNNIEKSSNNNFDIQERSLKDFSKYYLVNLKGIFNSFETFFIFVSILFWIQVIFSIVLSVIAVSKFGSVGLVSTLILTINLIVILWFVSLGKEFVSLQRKKVENDIHNTIKFQEESVEMAKNILEKAEQKAENNITMNGGNAIFAINGSNVSGSTQTINIQGDKNLIETLALLVSFCEESGNSKASEMAAQFSQEATKESPEKGVLIELWFAITGVIPEVAGIVKIAQGIKSLFL